MEIGYRVREAVRNKRAWEHCMKHWNSTVCIHRTLKRSSELRLTVRAKQNQRCTTGTSNQRVHSEDRSLFCENEQSKADALSLYSRGVHRMGLGNRWRPALSQDKP